MPGDAVVFHWMGQDQWFAEARRDDGIAFAKGLSEALGETASVTDQSDGWIQLRIVGPQARGVLEKLCPLDLHPEVFSVGSVARTAMEHLGVIVARSDEASSFRLLTARSSARSFLHALQVAADSTCGPRLP